MKTNQEIQAEAGQLMAVGHQFQNEQRIATQSVSAVAMPRVLAHLPMDPATPGRERHVDAAIAGGALVFRLMERESDLHEPDRGERRDRGTLLASSASAYDVLRAGYELAEQERLAAALERYADRAEDRSMPADGEAVTEVEAILETKVLPHADRLRTKAEVVEFMEGRLEQSELIAHAIERQCSRDDTRERQVERQEVRLTIGEP